MSSASVSAMSQSSWKVLAGYSASSFACALLLACGALRGQTMMVGATPGAEVHIFNTDSAILEAQEPRKDLPCSATPVKPALGFDLKFHAGYEVSIPLKELAGEQNLLTMIYRVTPEKHAQDPVYMSQRIKVPSIEENAKGDAYLQGTMDLGEGRYHVDWLMRDRSERVCSAYWDIDANLAAKDRQVALEIHPEEVRATDTEPFKDEPPIEKGQRSDPLNVKVIMNFAPQEAGSATLQPLDMTALVSILRNIAREPQIGKFSIVAFNLQKQRVVYRQENSSQINFPALGEALNSLKLGTVDVKKLSQKRAESEFLADLINRELNTPEHPDAVIFAGPKAMLDETVPQESLKQVGDVEYPVFYMNYNLNPQAAPWRDAIGNAVKYFKGFEYTISKPRDLWFAWGEIMSRIVKLKVGRHVAGAASQ